MFHFAWYVYSSKHPCMYAQSGAQGGTQAGPDANTGQAGGGQSSSNQGDNVQDADFEEVK